MSDVLLTERRDRVLVMTLNRPDSGCVIVDGRHLYHEERNGELVKYSDKIKGKLNGGGTEIVLSAHHNNVYLRKK